MTAATAQIDEIGSNDSEVETITDAYLDHIHAVANELSGQLLDGLDAIGAPLPLALIAVKETLSHLAGATVYNRMKLADYENHEALLTDFVGKFREFIAGMATSMVTEDVTWVVETIIKFENEHVPDAQPTAE